MYELILLTCVENTTFWNTSRQFKGVALCKEGSSDYMDSFWIKSIKQHAKGFKPSTLNALMILLQTWKLIYSISRWFCVSYDS